MRFRLKVKDDLRAEPWIESTIYEHEDSTARAWAEDLVKQYNDGIPRFGGVPRTLVEILPEPEGTSSPTKKPHEWEKTNAVTLQKGNRFYDTHTCKNCGITAKSFGLSTSKKRDAPWRSVKYEFCK